MRMWMVDPVLMCRQHLLGEHSELHMFVGTINKGIRIDGYLANNLLEIESLYTRHKELEMEMIRRGMNHCSPLLPLLAPIHESMIRLIDRDAARNELFRRCSRCGVRHC